MDTPTINQVYTYTLVFTIPSGVTLTNVFIKDALPNNWPRSEPRIYRYGTAGNYTGPAAQSAGSPPINAEDVSYCGLDNYNLCWSLPDIANDSGQPYVYQMTYQARVQSGGSQRGEVGTNRATLEWDGGSVTASSDVTIVAPNVQVKRIAYASDGERAESSGADTLLLDLRADEVIMITVLVTNVVGDFVVPAYNVSVTDYRPTWIDYDGIISGPAPDTVSGDRLLWSDAVSVLGVGETFAATYRAVVASDVAPGLDGKHDTRAQYLFLPESSGTSVSAGRISFQSPDVTVVKTVTDEPPDQGIVVMGEIVTYTVVYTLPGGTTVYNPTYLNDRLGDGLRFLGTTPPPAEVSSFNVDESGEDHTLLTWAITTPLKIPNDLRHSYVITARVSPTFFLGADAGQAVPKGWELTNEALLHWDLGPWPGRRDRASERVIVRLRRPQISPEKWKDGPQDQLEAGGKTVRFELREIRNGDGAADTYAQIAYNVLVTDTLPKGWTYLDSKPPGVSMDIDGRTVIAWELAPVLTIGSYLPGPSIAPTQYVVTATPPTEVIVGTRFTNTVDVAYSNAQGYRYVDRDELVMPVPLAVTKEIAPPSPAFVGDVITYSLVAVVPPRAILYWPHHYDTLPPGIHYTGWFEVSGGTLVDGPVTGTSSNRETLEWWWNTFDNRGNDAPLTFTFRFEAMVTGVDTMGGLQFTSYRGDSRFDNVSTIEWNTENISGTYPLREQADRRATVIQPYLVDSSKRPAKDLLEGGPTVESGDFITYGLSVYNTGKAPAYEVFINDTLPPGLVFHSYEAQVYPASGTGRPSYVPTALAAPAAGEQGSIGWVFDEIAEGDGNSWGSTTQLAVVYTLQVTDSVGAGATLINSAQIADYSTLPGDQPFERHYDYLSATDNRYNAAPVHVREAQIAKSASITEVALGGRIVFTITVPDQPLGATMYNVAVTDTMSAPPSGTLQVLSAEASGATALDVTSDTVAAGYDFIPAYSQATIVITARVPVTSDVESLQNDVIVAWDDAASAGARHDVTSDPVEIAILAPDVSVVKDAPSAVSPGSSLVYTMSYENVGTNTAHNVRLTDTLPVSVTFVSAGHDRAITQTVFPPGPLVWDLGSLSPSESGTVWITATAWPSVTLGSSLVNTVTVSTSDPGDDSENNQATATTIVSGAVLTVTKMAMPDPVQAGGRVLYSIVVTNSGNQATKNLVITDEVPPNTAFLDASSGGSLAGGVVTWNPVDIGIGAHTVVTFSVRVGLNLVTGTQIVNQAYGAMADNASSPSVSSVTVTVQSQPALLIEKAAPATTNPGDSLIYIIRYRNIGNAVAHNAQVVEIYDPNATFVTANPPPDEGNNLWYVGDVVPDHNYTIAITMNVGESVDRGTLIINRVTIDSDETEPLSDAVPTRVGGQTVYLPVLLSQYAVPSTPSGVNLVVPSIQVSPVSPSAGQATRVSVTLHNSGPNAVTDDFWVDLYVDPITTPTINVLWNDISPYGKAWIVHDDIPGGGSLVIHTDQPDDSEDPEAVYSNWPGWFVSAGEHVLYVQVDAYGQRWGYILEDNETDNVSGPKPVTVGPGNPLLALPPPVQWQERR
jgi:uncharacterized repeat protein (TIGR01451 family)